jgi:succinate dehydrogenase / fumarate reductase iron-sulfur subunit
MPDTIKITVVRGDKETTTESTYDVPTFEGMVVLDAVHYVQQHIDGTLACKCGSCSAEVDGRPKLMCKTRVDQYPSGRIHVGPLRTFPLVKDLVTDVTWNYRMATKIKPLTPAADAPRPFVMQQADVERSQDFRKCIECFLCQDVCHVLRDHNRKDGFLGPRHMIKIAGLAMHPMDELDRVKMIKEEAGIGFCNITKCCTEVCPEHIKITDNGIIPMKERVVDRYYDPVMRILNILAPNKK